MLHQTFSPVARSRSWQRGGAALAVIAGLLVVAASTLAIRMARQVEVKTQLQQLTQTRMARIRTALHAFAATHGRLPCPVAGATPDDSPTGAGLASPPGPLVLTCTAPNGTVPWVSLGIRSEDAQDAWGRKISFRVFDGLVKDDGIKNTASSGGLSVKDGAVIPPHTGLAWVLISHGVSGLGAWLPNGTQILPIPASQESINTQAPGGTQFFRMEESVVDLDPATSPNHFDDLLLFELLKELKTETGIDPDDEDEDEDEDEKPPVENAPQKINLTTAALDSVTPVSYSGRDTNRPSITINPGPDLGLIDITATGGNITRNGVPNGTAIGVCTSGCGNDNNSSLSGSESLSFKLQSKTAGKFALGILSLGLTVELAVTFRNNGADLPLPGGQYLSPLVSATPGTIKMFSNLKPVPDTQFDEVVVRPLGSSRFFIASIHFCAVDAVCD